MKTWCLDLSILMKTCNRSKFNRPDNKLANIFRKECAKRETAVFLFFLGGREPRFPISIAREAKTVFFLRR